MRLRGRTEREGAARPPLELSLSPEFAALCEGPVELRRLEAPGSDAAGLGRLATQLASSAPEREIRVVLRGSLARLMLLPWVDQLTGESRWREFAASRFEQTFGENLQDWDLQLASDWPGRDRLAAAWPAPVRAALDGCANVTSVRLEILEHLAALLAREPAWTGCLAEIGADGTMLVLVVRGRVGRARWRRSSDADGLAAVVRSEWAAVLDRARGDAASGDPVLAIVPPAPVEGSERAAAVERVAQAIGARRILALSSLAGPAR